MDGLHAREICTLFRWFKEGPPGAIPIEQDHRSVGLLQAATWEDAAGAPLLKLAAWHGRSEARQWLVEEVLQTPDRVLFWVKDLRGEMVGHVGLSALDAGTGTITLGDVTSGPGGEALVAAGAEALAGWVSRSLRLRAWREQERAAA
jgi:hypothetical protein